MGAVVGLGVEGVVVEEDEVVGLVVPSAVVGEEVAELVLDGDEVAVVDDLVDVEDVVVLALAEVEVEVEALAEVEVEVEALVEVEVEVEALAEVDVEVEALAEVEVEVVLPINKLAFAIIIIFLHTCSSSGCGGSSIIAYSHVINVSTSGSHSTGVEDDINPLHLVRSTKTNNWLPIGNASSEVGSSQINVDGDSIVANSEQGRLVPVPLVSSGNGNEHLAWLLIN